jgi:hypothetical protein
VSDLFINPFDADSDPDRHWIWHHLVALDSDAFVLGDWSLIEDDFDAERFEGIRCGHSTSPDDWQIAFATLADYRDSWVAASREFLKKPFVGISHREAVYRRCRLERIDINGERALAHKKFSGELPLADGTTLSGSRQTLYRLHRRRDGGGSWTIVGFLGQLPLDEAR